MNIGIGHKTQGYAFCPIKCYRIIFNVIKDFQSMNFTCFNQLFVNGIEGRLIIRQLWVVPHYECTLL